MANKTGHCGKRRFQLIVDLATVLWNKGTRSFLGVMEALGLDYGEEMVEWTDQEDRLRMEKARQRRGIDFLWRRKARKVACTIHEAQMRQLEGVQYGGGFF